MRGVLVGVAVAFAVALLGTPMLMRRLRAAGVGQPIQDEVTQHAAKAGTPTMGGVIVWVALVAGFGAAYVVLPGRPSRVGLMVVGVTVAAGLVGVVDDWLKVRRARNLGLRETQKTVMLLAVVGMFLGVYLTGDPCTHVAVTRCTTVPIDIGPIAWAAFAVALFWVTSNAVNFTDGIEGLLSGSAAASFAGLAVIAFWQFRHPADYPIPGSLDLAIIAATLAAACVGFLWWNGAPGTIFMGDTGSLAMGAALASLMLTMEVTMLLPVLGALYVAEGGSSSLQRYYFKATGGRRLFRMAPLHHHYEIGGWAESTVVVRFWILSWIAAALAVGIFYADALRLL